MIKGINVPQLYARGIWYVSKFVWDQTKWALYSSEGVVVALYPTKAQALAELKRIGEAQRGQA